MVFFLILYRWTHFRIDLSAFDHTLPTFPRALEHELYRVLCENLGPIIMGWAVGYALIIGESMQVPEHSSMI